MKNENVLEQSMFTIFVSEYHWLGPILLTAIRENSIIFCLINSIELISIKPLVDKQPEVVLRVNVRIILILLRLDNGPSNNNQPVLQSHMCSTAQHSTVQSTSKCSVFSLKQIMRSLGINPLTPNVCLWLFSTNKTLFYLRERPIKSGPAGSQQVCNKYVKNLYKLNVISGWWWWESTQQVWVYSVVINTERSLPPSSSAARWRGIRKWHHNP